MCRTSWSHTIATTPRVGQPATPCYRERRTRISKTRFFHRTGPYPPWTVRKKTQEESITSPYRPEDKKAKQTFTVRENSQLTWWRASDRACFDSGISRSAALGCIFVSHTSKLNALFAVRSQYITKASGVRGIHHTARGFSLHSSSSVRSTSTAVSRHDNAPFSPKSKQKAPLFRQPPTLIY